MPTSRVTYALGATLLCLSATTAGAPARAALPKTGAAAATGAPTVAAKIDAQAQALLDELKSALSTLNSFSATVSQTMAYTFEDPKMPKMPPTVERGTLAFQRPNFFKEASLPEAGAQVVSDGTHLYSISPYGETLYDTMAAPTNLDAVLKAARPKIAGLALATALFDSQDPLHLGKSRTQMTLSRGPSTQINGEPVDILVATWNVVGGSSAEIYYALDHADHLVRQEKTSYRSHAGTMTSTIILSDIKINPTLDPKTFTFVPPPDPVTPEAQAVLNKMTAAYAALNSFSAIVYMKTTGSEPMEGQSTLVIQRPNRLSATTVVGKEVTRTVSDGTHLFGLRTLPKEKATCEKWTAPPSFEDMDRLDQFISFPLALFKKDDPMDLKSMRRELKSLTVGAPGEADGTPVDNLEGQMKSPSGAGAGSVNIAIGRDDHLLRRITMHALAPEATFTGAFSKIQINPVLPPCTFRFTPPSGVKLLAANPAPTADPPTYDPRLKVGARPFAFRAVDLGGKPVNLSQYTGQVVMLDFWATWCPPCREEIPNVAATYRKYHAKGFQIVGISLDQAGDRAGLTTFLHQNGMTWRQIYDGRAWNSAAAKRYGVQAIPFALLIGRNGRIAAVDMRGDALGAAVGKAVGRV